MQRKNYFQWRAVFSCLVNSIILITLSFPNPFSDHFQLVCSWIPAALFAMSDYLGQEVDVVILPCWTYLTLQRLLTWWITKYWQTTCKLWQGVEGQVRIWIMLTQTDFTDGTQNVVNGVNVVMGNHTFFLGNSSVVSLNDAFSHNYENAKILSIFSRYGRPIIMWAAFQQWHLNTAQQLMVVLWELEKRASMGSILPVDLLFDTPVLEHLLSYSDGWVA